MKYGHKPKKPKNKYPTLQVVELPSDVKRAMRRTHRWGYTTCRQIIETGVVEYRRGFYDEVMRRLNVELACSEWFFDFLKCATSDNAEVKYRLVVQNVDTCELIPCRYKA